MWQHFSKKAKRLVQVVRFAENLMGEILPNARIAEKNYAGNINEMRVEKKPSFSKTRFLNEQHYSPKARKRSAAFWAIGELGNWLTM